MQINALSSADLAGRGYDMRFYRPGLVLAFTAGKPAAVAPPPPLTSSWHTQSMLHALINEKSTTEVSDGRMQRSGVVPSRRAKHAAALALLGWMRGAGGSDRGPADVRARQNHGTNGSKASIAKARGQAPMDGSGSDGAARGDSSGTEGSGSSHSSSS